MVDFYHWKCPNPKANPFVISSTAPLYITSQDNYITSIGALWSNDFTIAFCFQLELFQASNGFIFFAFPSARTLCYESYTKFKISYSG